MQGHDIIVVGASAGGVEALSTLVAGLPSDLKAAVFVVLHLSASSPSRLANILGRAGTLPVSQPKDGEHIKMGHVYVASPDHHLTIEKGHIRVTRGPKENMHRPAVDPLFRSAAWAYGPRVIGVVLSGALDDGTAGLAAIKARGGPAIVQDPNEALFPSMPDSALKNVQVDYKVGMRDMPSLLARLVGEAAPSDKEYPFPERMAFETEMAVMDNIDSESMDKIGKVSAFTCPDCHGTLWEMEDGELLRFRCRVGHAYSAESMQAQHDESLENALWAAMRALEESASLSRRMAERAEKVPSMAARYLEQMREKEEHILVMRKLILSESKAIETAETG